MNGTGSKRIHVTSFCVAVVGASALLIASCASQKAVLNPAQIEQEIAASKAEELDLIRSTIEEPERAERFIDLLAEREQLLERFAGRITTHKEQMAKLNADYDAERSEFETLLANYNRERATAQQELIDLITEMKQTTTADEWGEISAFQLDRLNPRQLAYRGLAGGG